MMKCRDLMKNLERRAEFTVKEGGNHTKVWVGAECTTVPRHNEIDDKLARKIMKQIGE